MCPQRASCTTVLRGASVTAVFYAFRDSPQRRAALAAAPGSAERYLLFGLDELSARGRVTRHNLESAAPPPTWARLVGAVGKRGLEGAGGYGGDFATVLASLRTANGADVILSTVDTVGIPLMLLGRAGRVRPPLVYVAIGLPERLARLRSRRMEALYADALARCAAVAAYSSREADDLEAWLEARGQSVPVSFVPFGVDTGAFRPPDGPDADEVVSIGADPHRDFELLLAVARSLPSVRFRIVASGERRLSDVPPNVTVELDLPFEDMRRRLERARAVALPVRENTYSGATTVLLQSMALGKPVVVSRTSAIAYGYGLVDGENCHLVTPGDVSAFATSVRDVLADDLRARALGVSARRTAERDLTWERYVNRIEELIDAAAASARGGSGPA
jgi:glycosyltransferase involved in cell wall biosynthesis